MTSGPAKVAIAYLPFFLMGCLLQGGGSDSGRSGDSPPQERDSIVVDLFSLNAALLTREEGGVLTPLGESRLQDLPGVSIGDELLFHTRKVVRIYSAHFVRERDIHCDDRYSGDGALIVLFDDGREGKCHDTAFAAPGYPSYEQVFPAYVEGKGFWIPARDVVFAIGKLKIYFDYQPSTLL